MYLPLGRVTFSSTQLPLKVSVLAYTPLIAHNLDASSTPAEVFDVTIENTSSRTRSATLTLVHSRTGHAQGNLVIFSGPTGKLAFAADCGVADANGVGVKLSVPPKGECSARFSICWYYPKVMKHSRYYTRKYADIGQVCAASLKLADDWRKQIEAWHDSIETPAYFKRLWFSSLASVMTSTVLTDNPYFFEIETPHPCLNTMDVCVYSNWVYLINWPELEKLDMEMYFSCIPVDGPSTGMVWHSLDDGLNADMAAHFVWKDGQDYCEEPIFIGRYCRDRLWFNEPQFSKTGFKYSILAAQRVYNMRNFEYLFHSITGKQGYDRWNMPGVNAYVNSAWIYGLDGLARIDRVMGSSSRVGGMSLADLRDKAVASFNRNLWNEKTGVWNCYCATPISNSGKHGDSLFTDQLFGKVRAGAGSACGGRFACRKSLTAHSKRCTRIIGWKIPRSIFAVG